MRYRTIVADPPWMVDHHLPFQGHERNGRRLPPYECVGTCVGTPLRFGSTTRFPVPIEPAGRVSRSGSAGVRTRPVWRVRPQAFSRLRAGVSRRCVGISIGRSRRRP
jgi:hypothetical protein